MKTGAQTWFRNYISQQPLTIISLFITVLLLIASSGCKDSTTEPSSSGQISMTTKHSASDSPSDTFARMVRSENQTGSAVIDSLQITRARFVLRDIKYKTQSDSSNFRAAPFVLELNLSSAIQNFAVAGVPFGSYRKIEFDVHRVNTNDTVSLSVSEQAQFLDFLAGERYSIIVSGTTYTAGISTAFTFKSKVNVKQKIDLDPELVINQSSPPINATMLISSGGWFKLSTNVLLDPSDTSNENTINDNLRASIKVFKDNNKDGNKDTN
ncbi:MAG: hypothetical protein EPO24_06105 [Bacteroidetes bacterium]|nr:MAG: hypothetical protein EPO24_06105 [Bacteroidota bacterium]